MQIKSNTEMYLILALSLQNLIKAVTDRTKESALFSQLIHTSKVQG